MSAVKTPSGLEFIRLTAGNINASEMNDTSQTASVHLPPISSGPTHLAFIPSYEMTRGSFFERPVEL